jgi:hypothetical protein
MAANGLGIGDGGAFENHCRTFAPMFNRSTKVEFTTAGRTIANTMLAALCFLN